MYSVEKGTALGKSWCRKINVAAAESHSLSFGIKSYFH